MSNLNKKVNGNQSVETLPDPSVIKTDTARFLDSSGDSLPSKIQAGAKPSRASSSRKVKRQLYADYRELLAFEFKAKKLNFLSLKDARSWPAPSQISDMPEGALPLAENGECNGHNGAAPKEPLDLPLFSPIDQPGVLVIDQRISMFFGSRRNLKSVVAANVAALLAWRMLAQGRTMEAMVFNDKKIAPIRPGHSRLHTLLLLQTVLNQNHDLQPNSGICSNPTMLNQALRRAGKLPGHPLIFLITDASGHDAETFRLTTNLSLTGDLLVILIYDPLQARLSDILRRQQINAGRFLPEGVPVAPINTRTDVTYQLRHSLIKSALSSFTKIHRAHSTPPALEVSAL